MLQHDRILVVKFGTEKTDGMRFTYALSLAAQLGFLVVSSIGGFLLLGYWLDAKLSTAPWLLVLGIIVGIIVTVREAYHLIKPLVTPDKTGS